MDNHHRKIDIQSASDLTYLLDNIRASAREKIDTAIPPQEAAAGEDIAYRVAVEELVQEYIIQTISLALPSLTINGFEPPATLLRPTGTSTSLIAPGDLVAQPTDDEISNGNYEPYDPRLAQKLRDLYTQLESESTKVAELRREAPGAAARQYVEALEVEMQREKGLEEKRLERMSGQGDEAGAAVLDVEGLKRKEDNEKTWERGLKKLVDLKKVPGVLAKAERADRAVKVVGKS